MTLLKIENLSKNYQIKKFSFIKARQFSAIKNISFSLESGKTLAIVGESGSGKSTLGRQIIGIEKPSSGKIFLSNQKLNFTDKKQRKNRFKNIRMIFQNPSESLNPQSRVQELLNEILLINTKLTAKQRKYRINETLLKVGLLPDHKYRYPNMFSGGQQQRVAIARAIILKPQIIIADEPLSALDVSIQAQILNLLQELQEEMNISYLFISHDLNVVERIADQVMVMFQGEMVEYGQVDQVFDNPKHPYTQTLFASTPLYKNRFPKLIPTIKKQKKPEPTSCSFASRCHFVHETCLKNKPTLKELANGHKFSCFYNQEEDS